MVDTWSAHETDSEELILCVEAFVQQVSVWKRKKYALSLSIRNFHCQD